MKNVNAILACDLNFGIGMKGDLPWPKNKEDLSWFRNWTLGHVVIMGRTTWESIGSKPLPKRTNVVVTSKNIEDADYVTSGDMKYILQRVQKKFDGRYIWIIGGEEIYRQALPYCDKLYLTKMARAYECDRFVDEGILDQFPKVISSIPSTGMQFEVRERI